MQSIDSLQLMKFESRNSKEDASYAKLKSVVKVVDMQSKLTNSVLLLTLSVLWAGTFVFIKIGDQSILPITLAAWRAVLGFTFIFIVAIISKPLLIRPLLKLRPQLFFLFNGLCIALMWYTGAKSEQVLTASMTSFLLTTLVIFSWIVATFFTKEKPFYYLNLIGILVAVLGVMVMLGFNNIFNANKDVWYALLYALGVLVFVIGTAVIKHAGIKTSPIVSVMYSLFYTMIILVLCAFVFENPLQENYTLPAILSIMGVGVLSTGIGYVIFFSLTFYAGQVFASLNGYLVPLLAFLMGVGFMHEPYEGHQIMGLLIVFVGIFATNRSNPLSMSKPVKAASYSVE